MVGTVGECSYLKNREQVTAGKAIYTLKHDHK
jgi:hypothetical protein